MSAFATLMILVLAPLAALSGDYTMTGSDFAVLENAITHDDVYFLVVDDARMPAGNAIAAYIPAAASGIGKAAVWIAASHANLLNADYTPTPDEHTEFLAALMAAAMDTGNAGTKWQQMYTDLEHADDPQKILRGLVGQFDHDGFTYHPRAPLATSSDEQHLLTAVLKELAPGVPGIVPLPQAASQLPSYDPLAHYVGLGADSKYPNQAIIYLNKEHLHAHGDSLAKDSDMLLPYLLAFVMATCDLGAAGPEWKQRYVAAAAADSALPPTVADRYQNRRALALPMAERLRSQLTIRR